MRAALGDAAVLKHDDLVGRDDRRQAVRDHDRGAALADQVERRLDLLLGVRIERRGRLVEDQDRRRLEDGAGDRHALLLAARELQPALADHGLVAVGQALDEGADLRQLGGAAHLVLGRRSCGRSGCCRRWCR